MSLGDIIAAGQNLYQAAKSLESFAKKYYENSATWNAFFGKVNLLQGTCERLNDRVQSSPVSLLVSEVRAFEAAEKQVEDVVRDLNTGEEGDSGRTWVLQIMFSDKIKIKLEAATEAVKQFAEHFEKAQKDHEDKSKRQIKRFESGCAALTYRDPSMNLYIPLQSTEEKILTALTKEAAKGRLSAQVVLVVGRGGQGKSSIVRYMCSKLHNDPAKLGDVFFMECGRQADVAAIQTVLLQWLRKDASRQAETPEKQSDRENSSATTNSTKELLRLRLQKEILLIMLDDVWTFEFLREFLKVSGPSTTFLVTSRRDICMDMGLESYISIQMENLRLDDAERIFAVHAGLPGRCTPPDRKDIAKRLFQRADYHPLVIAQLGAQLGKTSNKLALGIWQALEKDFTRYLDENLSKPVAGSVYPLSYLAVTEKSYDLLSVGAKHLFVLLGMCKGPSVSDVVLCFLVKSAFPTFEFSLVDFYQMKFELESSQLLSSSDESSMSMHDLTKEFISGKLSKEVNDLVRALSLHLPHAPEQFCLQGASDTVIHFVKYLANCFLWGNVDLRYEQAFQSMSVRTGVIVVLSCLYLNPELELTKTFVSQSGFSSDTFSELKRNTVSPITEKLVEESIFRSDYVPTDLSSSAIEVFLEFLCNDSLSHDNMLRLLACEEWIKPAAQFVGNLRYLDESFWSTKNKSVQAIVDRLVDLLQWPDAPESSDILSPAEVAFIMLSLCQDQNSHSVPCTPNFLQKLDGFLRQDQNPSLQCKAADALIYLAYGCDEDKKAICNTSTLLHQLLKLLSAGHDFKLQETAAEVIHHLVLTNDVSILNDLAKFPYLLEKLGECLTEENNPELQSLAARTLGRVAWGQDDARRSKIIKVSNMLKRLVQSVGAQQKSLQVNAAGALRNLAATEDSSILNDLVFSPNLLAGLGESLTKVSYLPIQHFAAQALASVAWGPRGEADIRKSEIIKFPKMLERLVQCLRADQDSNLQMLTARVLGNLSTTNLPVQNNLADFPNLLVGLGESLSKGNSGLQCEAAKAITNLAWSGDDALRGEILHIPQMLERLIECTIQHHNLDLRVTAAYTLPYLIGKGNVDRLDGLGTIQTLLDRLGEALTDKNIQEHGAGVIATLANKGDGTLKAKILDSSRLMRQLICCTSQDHSFSLQTKATEAIRYLAATDDTFILDKIMANFPNLLVRLGWVVGNEPDFPLKMEAAWALANLAGGEDTTLWHRVVDFPCLVDVLIQIPKSERQSDDEDEARAVGNLARVGDAAMKDKMASSKESMEWLAESLLPSWAPLLPENAAWAIGNIVSVEDKKIKQKVANFPGLWDKLSRALDEDGVEALKTQVARVLSNLLPQADHGAIEESVERVQSPA